MFDKFGNLEGADEINELARNLLKEGDTESIRALAKENGLDPALADEFITGGMDILCDDMGAAIGKLDIEAGELKLKGIMNDWLDYLKSRCFESEEVAKAVRRKDRNLEGAVAALLKWSFKSENQYSIPDQIKKAAGVTAGKVTLGIPDMGTAKRIMEEYYGGRA